jgi:hypothetical protein
MSFELLQTLSNTLDVPTVVIPFSYSHPKIEASMFPTNINIIQGVWSEYENKCRRFVAIKMLCKLPTSQNVQTVFSCFYEHDNMYLKCNECYHFLPFTTITKSDFERIGERIQALQRGEYVYNLTYTKSNNTTTKIVSWQDWNHGNVVMYFEASRQEIKEVLNLYLIKDLVGCVSKFLYN